MDSFRIHTSSSAGMVTIKVVGELDSGNCSELVDAFEQAAAEREQSTSMSLDLEAVPLPR